MVEIPKGTISWHKEKLASLFDDIDMKSFVE